MTTINLLAAAGTSPSTGAQAAGGAAQTGAVTGDGGAFGRVLVQSMTGSGGNTTAQSAVLPDLASLLSGLLATLRAGGDPAATLAGAEEDSAAWSLIAGQLAEKPELLDQLLGNEELQGWLVQTALLLQNMQRLPQTIIPEEAGQASAGQTLQTAQPQVQEAVMNTQQAQQILKAFSQASLEEPNHIFVSQLQEKLAAILGDKKETAPAVRSAHPQAAVPTKEAGTAELSWSVVSSPLSRLEMLAAKTMPLARPELTGALSEAKSLHAAKQESLSSSGEHQAVNAAASQDNARFAPLNKPDSGEGAVTVRAHAMAEDIGKFITGKIRVLTGSGITEARLSLTPESLGHVEVKLIMQNGQLAAHFAAQTAMGKDALEAQLAQLRSTLQNQGIQVEKIEVTQSPSLQSGMFQDQRGQQQSQQWIRRENAGSDQDGSEEYTAEASRLIQGKDTVRDGEGIDIIA